MEDPAVIAFIDARETTLKKQVEVIRKAIVLVSVRLHLHITEWLERL